MNKQEVKSYDAVKLGRRKSGKHHKKNRRQRRGEKAPRKSRIRRRPSPWSLTTLTVSPIFACLSVFIRLTSRKIYFTHTEAFPNAFSFPARHTLNLRSAVYLSSSLFFVCIFRRLVSCVCADIITVSESPSEPSDHYLYCHFFAYRHSCLFYTDDNIVSGDWTGCSRRLYHAWRF